MELLPVTFVTFVPEDSPAPQPWSKRIKDETRMPDTTNPQTVGPAVQIQKGTKSSETAEGIKDTCRVSFTVPPFSPLSGTFKIMHLQSVGGRLAWFPEKPTVRDRNGRVVTTSATATGTYALARLSTETVQGEEHNEFQQAVYSSNLILLGAHNSSFWADQ